MKTNRWVRVAKAMACLLSPVTGVSAEGMAEPENPVLGGSILVYCAAGIREPVEKISRAFTAEKRVAVEMTFANTGQLLGQIEATRKGDVYVPGEMGFAEKARAKGLVSGAPRVFSHWVPAIYVRKGNPKGIREVRDLAKPRLRLALVDPYAALGPIQERLFALHQVDMAALQKNVVATRATVLDVALAVKLGAADAGIIWEALKNYAPDEAEAIAIPPDRNVISTIAACVLTCARNPGAAQAFVDYLSSKKARSILEESGLAVENPVGKNVPQP